MEVAPNLLENGQLHTYSCEFVLERENKDVITGYRYIYEEWFI